MAVSGMRVYGKEAETEHVIDVTRFLIICDRWHGRDMCTQTQTAGRERGTDMRCDSIVKKSTQVSLILLISESAH